MATCIEFVNLLVYKGGGADVWPAEQLSMFKACSNVLPRSTVIEFQRSEKKWTNEPIATHNSTVIENTIDAWYKLLVGIATRFYFCFDLFYILIFDIF